MTAFIAFLTSPLGVALINAAPKLIAELISIAHEKGLVKPEEILTYIETQKTWDQIPPA